MPERKNSRMQPKDKTNDQKFKLIPIVFLPPIERICRMNVPMIPFDRVKDKTAKHGMTKRGHLDESDPKYQ